MTLIFFDHNSRHFIPVRNYLAVSVAPLQFAVNWPMQWAQKVQDTITAQQKLIEENAHLRMQLLLLNAKLQKYIAIQNENAHLRALLQSLPSGSERVLVAQIMAVGTDPFRQEVVLNKGSRKGVYVGQPVLDAHGLVGQVVQVAPNTSRVLLITDSLSSVPIENSRNGIRGIIAGRGDMDKVYLIHMSLTADVKPGDMLVTSGLGGHFPFGYPVGVIQSVTTSVGQEFSKIVVIPKAHLNSSRLVLLIWPDENNGKAEHLFQTKPIGVKKVSGGKNHGH